MAIFRGTFNRYTKRPIQDSTTIFSTHGMGESAFYYANQRVSCKFLTRKMLFAVFRSGSAVSEFSVSRGKNRMSQGVEHRGSLIGVPLALREGEPRPT